MTVIQINYKCSGASMEKISKRVLAVTPVVLEWMHNLNLSEKHKSLCVRQKGANTNLEPIFGIWNFVIK